MKSYSHTLCLKCGHICSFKSKLRNVASRLWSFGETKKRQRKLGEKDFSLVAVKFVDNLVYLAKKRHSVYTRAGLSPNRCIFLHVFLVEAFKASTQNTVPPLRFPSKRVIHNFFSI